MHRTKTRPNQNHARLGRAWRLVTVGVFFALAVALVGQASVPVASAQTPEANLEKLDPFLQLLVGPVSTHRLDSDSLLAGRAPGDVSPLSLDERLDLLPDAVDVRTGSAGGSLIDVIAWTTASESELRAVGAETLSRRGELAALRLPVGQLASLSALPQVSRVDASLEVDRTNDLAVSETGANLLQDPVPGYDGSGVVVGIIDTGLDLHHDDFRNPDGTTRVRALLDISAVGPHPSGGIAYTETQINTELLAPGTSVPQVDLVGHGTHVAGSAAGNGRAANASSAPAGTFAGVAIAAELVIVNIGERLSDAELVSGLSFIEEQAAVLGLPWVANVSFGGQLGAHDGTSAQALTVDSFSGPGLPGSAIVISAGNDGGRNIHASGSVVASPSGTPVTTSLTFFVPSGTDSTTIDLWYEGTDDFRFGWIDPSFSSGFLAASDFFPQESQFIDCFDFGAGSNCLRVTHDAAVAANGDNRIMIEMASTPEVALAAGIWTFQLEGDSVPAGGSFDAWSVTGLPFTSLVDESLIVGSPGTAANAITVGAYGTKIDTGQSVGPATTFSAPGPTRDGRLKPEVIAPGAAIFSSLSSDASPGDFGGIVTPGGLHVGIQGTSMSAPVVAGAVALVLQADPTLDGSEIRSLLVDTAREDEFTGGAGSGWDPKTGWGKLDVHAALSELLVTDAVTSLVEVADSEVLADGIATTTVTVTLRDNLGNPVVGSVVEVDDGPATATITPISSTTSGADGIVTFEVADDDAGIVTFTATDSTDGIVIASSVDVTFTTTASNVATLDDLTLAGVDLDQVFASGDFVYTANVGNEVDETTLTTILTDSGATTAVEVDDVLVNGIDPIALDVGETVIEVIVTAEDGLASQTYTVTVTRAAPGPSTDATLAALGVSPGTLDPPFEPGVNSYGVDVANAVDSIDVTATTADAAATLEVGGSPAISGVAEAVPISVGVNVIEVAVTAEDAVTELTYNITVTRAAPPAPDDASLMALSLSSGSLSPTFDPATLDYTSSVSNGVSSVGVTATPTNPAASVLVDPASPVALAVGPNVIEVEVTSEDTNEVLVYTITVTRAAAPPPPPPAPSFLTITPSLTVVNDDGGSASAGDFTVLLNGTAIDLGEAATGTSGSNQLTVDGPVSLYALTFSGDCDSSGSFTLPSLSALDCDIEADDQPLTTVLSEALPGAETLIDESLSFALDSFFVDGVRVVQASTAETTPLLAVTVPLSAVLGQSSITVSVVEGNADAARFNPAAGTVFIAGMAYDIQILDASGDPIEDFATPIELSFLLPDGVDASSVAAYFWDEDAGAWRSEAGTVVDGRFVVSTSHLTVFALFEFGDGGGVLGSLPASGVSLQAAEGGTIAQFRSATASRGASAVFVSHEGRLIGYLFNAPAFVNAEFLRVTGGVLTPGQGLMVVIGG